MTSLTQPHGASTLDPMDLLAHPFRAGPDGSIVTVEQDTDEDLAQELAITLLTRRGERPLVPDFGITDPAYRNLDLAELNVTLADFGPPIKAVLVEVAPVTDTVEQVTLTYQPTGGPR